MHTAVVGFVGFVALFKGVPGTIPLRSHYKERSKPWFFAIVNHQSSILSKSSHKTTRAEDAEGVQLALDALHDKLVRTRLPPHLQLRFQIRRSALDDQVAPALTASGQQLMEEGNARLPLPSPHPELPDTAMTHAPVPPWTRRVCSNAAFGKAMSLHILDDFRHGTQSGR